MNAPAVGTAPAARVLRRFTLYADGRIVGPSGITLSPFPVNGYPRVTRYEDGRFIAEPVHRLMCEAFHGPAPEGMPQVRHRDGNPANFLPSNLAWSDQPTNEADKVIHGTVMRGTRHHQARLTDDDIRLIRSMGGSSAEVAPLFGIHPGHVRRIRTLSTWKHVA